MTVNRSLVEGPDFVRSAKEAEAIVERLAENNWDFDAVPEVYSPTASADVLAKEIVHVFDGERMHRTGYLVVGGVGEQFNLMGPLPANSEFSICSGEIVTAINRHLGTNGLEDIPEFRELQALGPIQDVEFFNYSNFYQLRDLVFWLVLHRAGCFPSTLEIMVRAFASGNIVQNSMYRPRVASIDSSRPVVMRGPFLSASFPSKVVEWMDKPIFGGLCRDTLHVEYLLTTERSRVSHPYLGFDDEGRLEFQGREYYFRRFSGITPKDGVRGPEIPPEGKRFAHEEVLQR